MAGDRRKNWMNLLLVLIPVAVLFYILNWLTPIAFDDHTYAFSFDYTTGKQRITSVFQIPVSMYYHYFSMNGRVVTHFLAQLFMMFGKSVYNVVNTAAYLLLGVVMYVHARGALKTVSPFPLAFIYAALFLFSPEFGSSFLALTSASNYLYGPLLALVFLLPYRLSYDKNRLGRNHCIKTILCAAAMLLFGILAGNTNENNAVTLVVVTLVFVCVKWLRHEHVAPWSVTGAMGALIGCLLILLSPGTAARAEGKDMSILATAKHAVVNTVFVLEKHGIFLVILAVLVCMYYAGQVSKGKKLGFKENICGFLQENHIFAAYFLMFGLSFYAMSPVPYFTERAWSVHLIYLIISVVALYERVEKDMRPDVRRFATCAVSAALVLHLASVYVLAYKSLADVKQQHENRLAIIQEAQAAGERTVTLPAISSDSTYSVYIGKGDINEDHTHWTNTQIAKYYGLDTVYLEPNDVSAAE